jgi:hypothetical protein
MPVNSGGFGKNSASLKDFKTRSHRKMRAFVMTKAASPDVEKLWVSYQRLAGSGQWFRGNRMDEKTKTIVTIEKHSTDGHSTFASRRRIRSRTRPFPPASCHQ